MNAMYEIRLPRAAKASDFAASQAEKANEQRINMNFKNLSDAAQEQGERINDLPAEVLKDVIVPDAYVTATDSDGLWDWRKWSDGTIEAWRTTAAATKGFSTSVGSLYASSDETISMPESVFEAVSALEVTPVCEGSVFVTVKTVSAAAATISLLSPMQTSASVQLCLYAIGK